MMQFFQLQTLPSIKCNVFSAGPPGTPHLALQYHEDCCSQGKVIPTRCVCNTVYLPSFVSHQIIKEKKEWEDGEIRGKRSNSYQGEGLER